jgi:hypothetical protein
VPTTAAPRTGRPVDAQNVVALPDLTLGQFDKVCLAYTAIGAYRP